MSLPASITIIRATLEEERRMRQLVFVREPARRDKKVAEIDAALTELAAIEAALKQHGLIVSHEQLQLIQ
jgi:hypothetical protein